MSLQPLVNYLDQAAVRLDARWAEGDVRAVAAILPPGELFGQLEWWLRGDLGFLWARWAAEGLCDPRRYPDRGSYPRFVRDVARAVDQLGLKLPADEVIEITRALLPVLWKRIEQQRPAKRRGWTQLEKDEAWAASEPGMRCWICGFRFPDWALQRYQRRRADDEVELPAFVDAYRPRGVHENDLRIEIDHVIAVAAGGSQSGNLRLACGWCNRHKSARQVVYDATSELRELSLSGRWTLRLPPAFWVVRLLALRGRCEDASGCSARSTNAELTVAPLIRTGAPTPTNLWVTCQKHDPLRERRLVAADVFRRRPRPAESPEAA